MHPAAPFPESYSTDGNSSRVSEEIRKSGVATARCYLQLNSRQMVSSKQSPAYITTSSISRICLNHQIYQQMAEWRMHASHTAMWYPFKERTPILLPVHDDSLLHKWSRTSIRDRSSSVTHMAASVPGLPPVLHCHSLCCTSSPPLWTGNHILDLTGHLRKIRSSSYSYCDFVCFFCLVSLLRKSWVSQTPSI